MGTVFLNCNQEGKFPNTLMCMTLSEILRGLFALALSARGSKVTQLLINEYYFILQVPPRIKAQIFIV